MTHRTPVVMGIAVAVVIAVASVAVYAYAANLQSPQRRQPTASNAGWGVMGDPGRMMGGMMNGMMGAQPWSTYPYQPPASPSSSAVAPRYGPGLGGMGMMGGAWGEYGPHCPMMGGPYGAEYTGVWIANYAFYPQTLTVKKGTTVTWTNMDFVAHTVESGTHEQPTGLFDSGLLDHMQSFSYTFSEPGTYTYHCDPHPSMTGTIIVEE